MTEHPDRLAEIKACKRWHECDCQRILLAEVERLRGRLRELEWAAPTCMTEHHDTPACPACRGRQRWRDQYGYEHDGHYSDCWLAAEFRST